MKKPRKQKLKKPAKRKPQSDQEIALSAATMTIGLALDYLKRTSVLLPRCAVTDPETASHLEAAIRQSKYVQMELRRI